MYGNDSYGGTEYAGVRSRSIVTIVSGAVKAVYLLTKDTTATLLTKDTTATLLTKIRNVILGNS